MGLSLPAQVRAYWVFFSQRLLGFGPTHCFSVDTLAGPDKSFIPKIPIVFDMTVIRSTLG
jgi:hypothetical protein